MVSRTGGVALVATGLALPTLNQVLVDDSDAMPTAIAAAVDVTRGRGDSFVVSLTIRASMGPWLLDRPEASVCVGYTDGVPVTAGLGVRTGRTIGIYTIATIEAARRRGYGSATERIAADDAAASCDVAVLQATPMGLHTYLRLGYRTVVEYVWYRAPVERTDEGHSAG